MYINASGSWNEYRYSLTYKHPAFKMVSLHHPWEWRMQLPQRVENNSIALCVQGYLQLCTRVRADEETLVTVYQKTHSPLSALLYIGFLCSEFTNVRMTRHTVLFGLSYIQSWVFWFGESKTTLLTRLELWVLISMKTTLLRKATW